LDCSTIIIQKLDRLARDLTVQEIIVQDIQKKGLHLVSVQEGPDLASDDPTRTMVRQIMGAVSQYEKTMIVQKLKIARERVKARDGKCEGRKSYEETDPQLIALLRGLYRKPRGGKRASCVQIARELNNRGIKTRYGKQFSPQHVNNLLVRYKIR